MSHSLRVTARRQRPARPQQRTSSGSRRRVVCALSVNPLALMELERRLARVPMRVRYAQIDLNGSSDVHDVRVPPASVYVVDAWSTGAATEAVVSGIRRRRNARVVVVLAKATDATCFPLLQLGVKGLVPQRDLSEHLSRAVALVASGGVWIPRLLLSRFLEHTLGRGAESSTVHPPVLRRISQRERQVLNCVLKSQSNKEIGAALNISESTVKFHLARLFEKFGVRRRADLILQTVQQPESLVH